MSSYRKTATVVGVLLIIATAIGILGGHLANGVVDTPDYLLQIATHRPQLVLGVIIKVITACSCAGIAIALYPVLEQHNRGLALGSVAFRLLEGVFYMIGALNLMTLVTLSAEAVSAGAQGAEALRGPAAAVLAGADWAGLLGVIPFTLGGLMYYVVLYRARLVPRWLSLWGCLAVASSLTAILLTLFDLLVPFATPFALLQMPIFLQELVMGVWLIVRGFSPAAAATKSPRPVVMGTQG